MYKQRHICAIIPARDEALSVGKVVTELLQLRIFERIIVCDNNSRDNTAEIARNAGAEVVFEASAGYGAACLKALSVIKKTDVVVFVDADDSLQLDESLGLINALIEGADLAIGARVKQWQQNGSMTPAQRFGNRLATWLIRLIWKQSVTDLGPFRAIRFDTLKQLEMRDKQFGWTVEMQVKAIQRGDRIIEIPVHYQRRIGRSKISGTLKGVIGAGIGIIGTIVTLAICQRRENLPVKQANDNPPHTRP
jgi:glycosyltransferase involved in cell wall biosynthesis